jgi:3-hydroxyisobutyrate dehydrogenase-like beta-hydroxyacid dehydrogenase
MGQRAAEEGTLTVLVGGERHLFERCRPVFEAFGDELFHLGEQVGTGQVAKMVNNLLLWTGVAGVHAYFTLAGRLGVNPARLRAALQASSADSHVLRELDLINLTWPDKDLVQAMDVAEEAGVSLPLIGHVRDLLKGLRREDLTRLCRDADDRDAGED